MCTQRTPFAFVPSNRIRNCGKAVCRKRIVALMSRTRRLACSSRTVMDQFQDGAAWSCGLVVDHTELMQAALIMGIKLASNPDCAWRTAFGGSAARVI